MTLPAEIQKRFAARVRAWFGPIRRTRRVRTGWSVVAEALEARLLLSAASLQREARRLGGGQIEVDGFPLPTDITTGGNQLPEGIAPYSLSSTFNLNSRAGATKTIYLDFDGHTTSGTIWNSSYTGGAAINTPAFSTDGAATFSDAELERIQYIWQRVAEDFAPFDVNVTTADPGAAALSKSGAGDTQWGIRVAIGGSWSDWFGTSAGGVAYVGSFNASVDQPVFVFANNLSNSEKYVAEAISHETGHSLGLSHDGNSTTGYYSGHGSGATGWAPIMGVGYYQSLTQWSKGQYTGANNLQDDLSIITSNNGFGYRADDYGSSLGTAASLGGNAAGGVSQVNLAGLIERNTDQDWFKFTTTGGSLSLSFSAASRGANLDVYAGLYNASGQLVASSNPADQINASISTTLAAGTYYLMVDGVGARTLADGYSDYGSLGQYSITGSYADDGSGTGGGGGGDTGGGGGTTDPVGSIAGRVWHDADGDAVIDAGEAGIGGQIVYLDTNANGLLDGSETSVITGSDGSYAFSGLASGTYTVREVVGAGWQQIGTSTQKARSISLAAGQAATQIDFRNVRPSSIANLGDTVSYAARKAATILTTTAAVSDADTTVFNGGRLTVSVTANGDSADRLEIRNEGSGSGKISLKGNTIRYGGVVIGTKSGGSGTTPLTIVFNSNATTAAVTALLRNVSYRSTASNPNLLPRTIQFVLEDGSGGASGPASKQVTILAATRVR